MPAESLSAAPASTARAFEIDPPERRIWLVRGDRRGDNAQIHIIADSLGWSVDIKQVICSESYLRKKPRFRPAIHHLDKARSDRLAPPWPDLVITSGRWPSMAALWVREQSAGRAKVVVFGRPKRMLGQFDLVIGTGQYVLPKRPNVLHIDFPLMRVDEDRLAAAASRWAPRLEHLPRPITALLVGGPTKPFVFDERVAKDLATQAAHAARMGTDTAGTLYAATSPRTPQPVVESLQGSLPSDALMYRWAANDDDNPYLGLLAFADRFIVTGDSISMMVEVARLGKPLAIFALPSQKRLLPQLRDELVSRLGLDSKDRGRLTRLSPLHSGLDRFGLVKYRRDLTTVHSLLIENGLAVPLGAAFLSHGRDIIDELPRVVNRIKALFETS